LVELPTDQQGSQTGSRAKGCAKSKIRERRDLAREASTTHVNFSFPITPTTDLNTSIDCRYFPELAKLGSISRTAKTIEISPIEGAPTHAVQPLCNTSTFDRDFSTNKIPTPETKTSSQSANSPLSNTLPTTPIAPVSKV
jgi:hypothetical protein